VLEYWIVSWEADSVEIYRRQNIHLELFATLTKGVVLESPSLPGLSTQIEAVFAAVRTEAR